jgi:hypothetical protein
MANNGSNNTITTIEIEQTSAESLRKMLRMQRIATSAVEKAQEENRRLGIPNWYSINGHIVSDIEIEQLAAQRAAIRNGKPAVAVQQQAAD